MTDKNHWKKIELSRKPFDVMSQRLFRKALLSLIEPYLKKLNESDEYAKMIEADISFSDIPIRHAMVETYQKTGLKFAKLTQKKFKSEKKDYDPTQLSDDQFIQDMRDYALNQGGSHITWISQSAESEALNIIRATLDQASAEGWGVGKLAQTMRDELQMGYSNYARYASERIARTEITAASNYGSHLGANSTGYPMKKRWIATYDSRVRDAHAVAGAKYQAGIDINEPYFVGGEDLMFPGDPSGSASNIIQCRCTESYEVV